MEKRAEREHLASHTGVMAGRKWEVGTWADGTEGERHRGRWC